jgi:choline transport protein
MLLFVLVVLLSLINIGSTVAFNALISLTTLGLYSSYAIAIIVFVVRRFNKETPIEFGPWTMGKFGLIANVLGLAFSIFIITILPFPVSFPDPLVPNRDIWKSLVRYGLYGASCLCSS